ncbi:MAG: hypothetical protein WBE40_01030 [Thermoplasmata archaeon]
MPGPASVPRFSDTRVNVRWILAVVVPTAVATLTLALFLSRPEPALEVGILGSALLPVAAALGVWRGRLSRVDSR